MELPWPLPEECRELLAGMSFESESFTSTTEFGSKNLPWPLPVRHTERSYATVVSSKSTPDSSGKLNFYAYSIRYHVVEIGTEQSQRLATEFALITADELDDEVVQMAVNLYLPTQACVVAKTQPCGMVVLSADELDHTRRFNEWLFSVVLGKPPVPAGFTLKYMDSPKGYYILPLKDSSHEHDFDWTVVESALISGMVYRKKVKFFGGIAKLEVADIDCDVTELKPGQLILRNGRFSKEDLDDAMITCAHNGMPCYITAISDHINGCSCFPGDNARIQSYADYYASKYEHVAEISVLCSKFLDFHVSTYPSVEGSLKAKARTCTNLCGSCVIFGDCQLVAACCD